MLEFVSNQEYGVLIKANSEEIYLDLDLEMGGFHQKDRVATESLFVAIVDSVIFLSINGLSYTDVIFMSELNE